MEKMRSQKSATDRDRKALPNGELTVARGCPFQRLCLGGQHVVRPKRSLTSDAPPRYRGGESDSDDKTPTAVLGSTCGRLQTRRLRVQAATVRRTNCLNLARLAPIFQPPPDSSL